MVATAYAKSISGETARVQPLADGLASPCDPLEGRGDSFDPTDVLIAARLSKREGREVAGGRLLAGFLQKNQAVVKDSGLYENGEAISKCPRLRGDCRF